MLRENCNILQEVLLRLENNLMIFLSQQIHNNFGQNVS